MLSGRSRPLAELAAEVLAEGVQEDLLDRQSVEVGIELAATLGASHVQPVGRPNVYDPEGSVKASDGCNPGVSHGIRFGPRTAAGGPAGSHPGEIQPDFAAIELCYRPRDGYGLLRKGLKAIVVIGSAGADRPLELPGGQEVGGSNPPAPIRRKLG